MINWQNGTMPINETNMNQLVQEDMITDAYSSSSTYSVGDYCIYGNTLYKCTTAITTAEAWNSAHWTAVSVADEINARVKKSGDTMSGDLTAPSFNGKWNGFIEDFGTENTVDTWLPVLSSSKLQHRTIANIISSFNLVQNNDTGWQAIPLTSPATTVDWNVLMYRKINGVVYIKGTIYWNQTPNWGTQFGLLPNGFRPIAEFDCVCRSINVSTGSATVIAISSDGTMIYLNNTDWTPGEGCFINCCFIAEN